jgi:putative ABC transport system permease protein
MFLRLFKEGFIFALNSIFVNKLRTFLSLFGITIGIFSIISVFTVLDWMAKGIRDSISSLGDNVLYVHKFPWGFNMELNWFEIIKRPAVSRNDYLAILNKTTKSKTACFTIRQSEQVKYKKNIASEAGIWAVTPEFDNIRSFEIEKGRYFSPEEAASGKNVAIVGAVLAEKLFKKSDPVGKQITIAGKRTNIIGVFKKEGKGGISDSGMDEETVVPYNFGKIFINMRNDFLDA